MTRQAPATIAQDVAEAIKKLIHSGDQLRDWNSDQVVVIRDELRKLQKVDARQAFKGFGMLAAICGRLEDLAEFYRKARLQPDKLDTEHDFWLAFSNVGLYRDAFQIGDSLLEPRHGFFPKIWQRAVARGHVRGVVERWSYAKKTYADLDDNDIAPFLPLATLMANAGLTDKDIVGLMDLMGEVQREQRRMFAGSYPLQFRIDEANGEGSAYLYGMMEIDADVAKVQAMNRKLAKLVAERLGAFPSGLVVAFRKVRVEPLSIAA